MSGDSRRRRRGEEEVAFPEWSRLFVEQSRALQYCWPQGAAGRGSGREDWGVGWEREGVSGGAGSHRGTWASLDHPLLRPGKAVCPFVLCARISSSRKLSRQSLQTSEPCPHRSSQNPYTLYAVLHTVDSRRRLYL